MHVPRNLSKKYIQFCRCCRQEQWKFPPIESAYETIKSFAGYLLHSFSRLQFIINTSSRYILCITSILWAKVNEKLFKQLWNKRFLQKKKKSKEMLSKINEHDQIVNIKSMAVRNAHSKFLRYAKMLKNKICMVYSWIKFRAKGDVEYDFSINSR